MQYTWGNTTHWLNLNVMLYYVPRNGSVLGGGGADGPLYPAVYVLTEVVNLATTAVPGYIWCYDRG